MTTKKRLLLGALAGVLLVATGCAGRLPPPQHLRASDPSTWRGLDMTRPVVIEFQPGDVIPLRVEFGGPLVTTPAGLEPIPLTVQRRFFLRVDRDGIATSLDGVDFDAETPGSFRFGVDVTRERGVGAVFAVRTPTHRE